VRGVVCIVNFLQFPLHCILLCIFFKDPQLHSLTLSLSRSRIQSFVHSFLSLCIHSQSLPLASQAMIIPPVPTDAVSLDQDTAQSDNAHDDSTSQGSDAAEEQHHRQDSEEEPEDVCDDQDDDKEDGDDQRSLSPCLRGSRSEPVLSTVGSTTSLHSSAVSSVHSSGTGSAHSGMRFFLLVLFMGCLLVFFVCLHVTNFRLVKRL
jgi:hypothetical protein